jgi:hypothetical protein
MLEGMTKAQIINSIHIAAIEYGNIRNMEATVNRLRVSNVDTTISSMLDRLKPDAIKRYSQGELIEKLGQHLWGLWCMAELKNTVEG